MPRVMDPPDVVCEVQANDRRTDVRTVGALDLEAAGGAAEVVDEPCATGVAHVIVDFRGLAFTAAGHG